MTLRHFLPIVVVVFLGCRDEPPPARILVPDEPAPREKTTPTGTKKADAPLGPPPAKVEEIRAKLVPLDLRGYGIYAEIDAPIEAAVRQLNGTEITGSDGYSLTIRTGSFDVAKVKREASVDTKSKILADAPDAVFWETKEGGTTRFSFYVNVAMDGDAYQIGKLNDAAASAEQARRNFEAARSLRRTPALKASKQNRDFAENVLRDLGARIELIPDASNTRQILFAANRPLQDKDLMLLADLPDLAEVDLNINSPVTAEGFEKVRELPRLTRLAVGGAWVNAKIMERIGDMSHLQVLRITGAPISDAMVKSLTRLTELTKLHLNGVRITDKGLHDLQELKTLKYLHLNGTDVTDKGLAYLKDFDLLRELSLSDTAITDGALAPLAALPELIRLDVSDTAITDAGIDALVKVPRSRALAINFRGTNVTAAGVAKLKKAAGNYTLLQTWPIVEPDPAKVTPPQPLDALPPADPAALFKKLGVSFKPDAAEIDLRGKKVNDADLAQLRSLTKLRTLNLDDCPAVTDVGLLYLAGLTDLEELHLIGTSVIGDGFAALKGLTKLSKLYLPSRASSISNQFTSKQLAPLTELPNLEVISFWYPEVDYPVLAALSKMTKLKQLNLENLQLNNHKMEFLRGLKNLEVLNLGSEGQLSDRGLECLQDLPSLKTLVMRNYFGSNLGLRRLAEFPNLRGLETLKIKAPLITDYGIAALTPLENLKHLRLEGSNIGDQALASLPNRDHLVELGLAGASVSDRGLAALAALSELESLDLNNTAVTDAGIGKLKELKELRVLRLGGDKIDGHGLKELRELPHLHRLELNGSPVDDAGVAAICYSTGLVVLDLSGTNITDAALDSLLKLPYLDTLDLKDCKKLTDVGAAALARFPKLKQVNLNGTIISANLRDQLRKAKVKVEYRGDLP